MLIRASRRCFLAALAAVITPMAAAQNRQKRLIGIVADRPQVDAIREGLKGYGWMDGGNVRILSKEPKGRLELAREIIEEYVGIPVDILVVFTDAAAALAIQATRTTPVVMLTTGAIVEDGLVSTLARPNRNLTGLSFDAPRELTGKRLALLKSVAPQIQRVGFLVESIGERGEHEMRPFTPETRSAVNSLRIELVPLLFRSRPEELERALAEAAGRGLQGLLVSEGVLVTLPEHQQRIHEFAIRHRIAVLHSVLRAVQTGGLMGYGLNFDGFIRRLPYFIDRILRGAKPAELPIEQPQKLELVLNKKAAEAIGLPIPRSLLVHADRVIE